MFYILVMILMAAVCGAVARHYGRSVGLHFVVGLLIWPISLAYLLLAGPLAAPKGHGLPKLPPLRNDWRKDLGVNPKADRE